MSEARLNFPFSAVASQPQFKLALLLAAVNPLIGGVLVSGPRGSAKSTLAKGLADILPCRAGKPQPFVTLPLGASEEMLLGTLNLQQVLSEKNVEFQPGLLAKAHNGVLYVDEVNLLPDNLVDQLLDVAASGVNTVERDGISHRHPARFILLGTMNPDEGELRPQLTDRFGFSVTLSNQYALQERIDIVRLRESFDKDAAAFLERYRQQQQALTEQIVQAQTLLGSVSCPDECRQLIAERCCEAQVDGLRADIVWLQAALAHAAIACRVQVSRDDVLAVEALVLEHRRNNTRVDDKPDRQQQPFSRPDQSHSDLSQSGTQGDWGAMDAEYQQTQPLVEVPELNAIEHLAGKPLNQRMSALRVNNREQGSAGGFSFSDQLSTRINWFSSLLANAGDWPLATLRYYRQRRGRPVIHLVLLDTSGSVLANQGLAGAKGLILHIAEQAYVRREQFCLLGFGNQQVDTLLDVRRAPKAILNLLDNIAASGGTPLHEALQEAARVQQRQLNKCAAVTFRNYLLTDGRVSRLDIASQLVGDMIVIDVERSSVKRGRARQIAAALQADYVPLMV